MTGSKAYLYNFSSIGSVMPRSFLLLVCSFQGVSYCRFVELRQDPAYKTASARPRPPTLEAAAAIPAGRDSKSPAPPCYICIATKIKNMYKTKSESHVCQLECYSCLAKYSKMPELSKYVRTQSFPPSVFRRGFKIDNK